jgi:hypothetical protein
MPVGTWAGSLLSTLKDERTGLLMRMVTEYDGDVDAARRYGALAIPE